MKELLWISVVLIQGIAAPQVETGAIAGRLLSANGTAAAGIQVTAVPILAREQSGIAAPSFVATTDDAGRFRLENIGPGRYHITSGMASLPIYYPGTISRVDAAIVTVTARSTTEGIDLTMPVAFKVGGRLAIQPSAPPSTPIRLRLSPSRNSSSAVNTLLQPDGTFEFPPVPPEAYRLWTNAGLPITPVTVIDRDINEIRVGEGAPGFKVKGRILNAPAPRLILLRPSPIVQSGQALLVPGLLNQPRATPTAPYGISGVTSNADGTFEFLRVPPGTYLVQTIPDTMDEVVIPSPSPSLPSIVVVDRDLSGVEITP